MTVKNTPKINLKTICDLWLPLEDLAETVAISMINQAQIQSLSTVSLEHELNLGDHENTEIWQVSFTATKKQIQPNTNLEKSYQPDFIRTVDEVKQILYQQGLTLKEWAEKNGYKPVQVYRVMRGENKALYGEGHRIAVAIGLKSQ